MTPPMTPREKVELKPCPFCGGDAVAGSNFDNDHYVMCGADCDKCGGMVGYMKTEMAAIENWNRRTALASSSGDHAELVLMANAALEIYSDDVLVVGGTRRIHADNIILYVKNGVDGILAENAALRAERVTLVEQKEGAEDALFNALTRATEAERKLAEAVGLLRDVVSPGWTRDAWSKARSFLSKEAERG